MHFLSFSSLALSLAASAIANPMPVQEAIDLESRQTASGCEYLYDGNSPPIPDWPFPLSSAVHHEIGFITDESLFPYSAAPRCCVPSVCQCGDGKYKEEEEKRVNINHHFEQAQST